MRHNKKFNHLGRKSAHRKAMLANMASSLIENKRISTTIAKAKALRKHIEPLITKSKTNTTHSRRVLFSYLQDKESVKELFDVIAPKIGERPGGYVRVIRTGFRQSDAAEMAMIEFVDFNDVYAGGGKKDKAAAEGTKKKRTRRGRSSKAKAAAATAAVVGSSEEE